MSDPFDTLPSAVQAAALAARDKFGNKQEAIGLVYEKDGKFFYTDPYSTKPKRGKTKATFKIPKGSLRYIVHNHPDGGQDNTLFSPEDVDMATKLNVPSAIVFGTDKPIIRTFTPGKTSTQSHGRGAEKRQVSIGDELAFDQQEAQDLNRMVQVRVKANASRSNNGY